MRAGPLCPGCGEVVYGGRGMHSDCYTLADLDRHREIAPCVRCRRWLWRDQMNDDFDTISRMAGEVSDWADKLSDFTAICSEGEGDDGDIEKFVPTA